MAFKTQYDARDRIMSNPGNPIKQLYSGSYNERGQVELKEDGTEDLYAFIQSFAESTDIHAIMRRYENGEVDVLEKVQGFYGDVTDMPKTYAEALQRISDSEKVFMSLPVDVRAKFGHSFSEFLAATNDADFLERLGVQVDKHVASELDSNVVKTDVVKTVVDKVDKEAVKE